MKNPFITVMLILLALCLSSCSNGSNGSSTGDCSSLKTTIGAATLIVSPSGNSSYTVQGTGMDGVAGIQLEISYDSDSLAAPTVTRGELVAGAMFVANTSQPGFIKIAVISTKAFSGSGQVAEINFGLKTGIGSITSITTRMIDSQGLPPSSQTNKLSLNVEDSSQATTIPKSEHKAVGAIVSITPSGDSSYSIQGTEMDGVAGIQFNISYDSASLANPTVTLGGLAAGAMFAANTSQSGLIKIAIISTKAFSGSGQIATITFASRTGTGGITSITSSTVNNNGAQIPVQASYSSSVTATQGSTSSPSIPFSQTTSAPQSSQIPTNQVIPAVTATLSRSCR